MQSRGDLSDKTLTLGLKKLQQAYRRLASEKLSVAKILVRQHPWLHLHQALRYIELFGVEDSNEFIATREDKIMKTIRINTLKTDIKTIIERMSEKGFKLEKHPYIDYGVVIRYAPYSPGATMEYLLGYYTIQGPASMMAIPSMEPIGSHAVDLCSGAGTKTTQIAQHNPNANIVAFDINRKKLAALKNNAARLAVPNILAFNEDSRKAPDILGENTQDNVLLDAPCSGEGLIPYEKGRWPRSFDDIISRMRIQYSLARAAARLLRDNGVLVYSTCTISVEENEYLISLLLNSEPYLEPEPPPISGGSEGVIDYLDLPIDERLKRGCRRFYPHIHRTEGFTICRLRRRK